MNPFKLKSTEGFCSGLAKRVRRGKVLVLALSLTAITSYTLLAQGSGTPSTLRVKTDVNGYLILNANAQTLPITTTVFSNTRLKTDVNGYLQVTIIGAITPTTISCNGSIGTTTSVIQGGNPCTWTTTPTILGLTVNNAAANGSGIIINQTSTSGLVYGIQSNVTGASTTNKGGFFSASGATNNYGIDVSVGSGANNYAIYSGGGAASYFGAGIGIGASPFVATELLTVNTIGSRNGGFNFTGSTTGGSGGVIGNTSAGGHTFNLFATGSANGPGAGTLSIFDQTSAAYRFVIGSTGNIGINGVQVPNYSLDTTGSINAVSFVNNNSTNGQTFTALQTLTELTTIAAAATTDTTIQMPANSVVLGVTVRVTTVIPTCATFTVGDSGSAARFSTAAVSCAATSTDPGTKAAAYYNASALSIRITPNAQPANNSGRVRVTIYYYTVTPSTS